jgi:hypothetical protein
MNKFTVRCKRFKPLVRNTLRGFADVFIVELKLTISDIAVHTKAGKCWAQLPAKPQVRDGALVKGDDGKIQYIPIMQWDSRAVSDAFSRAAVAAVRELAPDAFEGIADGTDVRGSA